MGPRPARAALRGSADRVEASLSETELEGWGERIGRHLARPAVLALRGDLGAGKSTLARAIARGAGVQGEIPSPTFNLIFTYSLPDGGRLHHLDLYRLEHPDEVWELGWAELGAGADLVLIEWPERAEDLLPAPRWDIELTIAAPAFRHLRALPMGDPPPLPSPL